MAPNRFYSTSAIETSLTGNITNTSTSCAVAAITGYPTSTPFTIAFEVGTANEEVAEVTLVAGTTFTINRGVDGSGALSHTAGAKITHVTSARDFAEPQGHMGNSIGVHGVTGSVVGTTDTQTLVNKTLTAPSITTPAVTNPTVTGGGSWAGSPSITTPAITTPVITAGGSWAGSPTITTPTVASFINMAHDHSAGAGGANIPQASVTGLAARLTTDETNISNLQTNVSSNTSALGPLTSVPIAVMKRTALLSIADNTGSAIFWDAEDVDSHNGHDLVSNTNRYTAQRAGWYLNACSIVWQANATGPRELKFVVNGTTNYPGNRFSAVANVSATNAASRLIFLNAGDYVEISVYQNSGVALNVDHVTQGGTRWDIYWVRP